MNTNIVMPKAGLTMTEGTITQWMKTPGSMVHKGDVLLVIENEKSTIDVESTGAGLLFILYESGSTVPVGEVIAVLADSQAEYDQLKNRANTSATSEKVAPVILPQAPPVIVASTSSRYIASPLARKIAARENVDLSRIVGTGPHGRIVEKDVWSYLDNQKTPSVSSAIGIARHSEEGEPIHIPLTGMRKAIARHMLESLQSMAQVSASVELDVSNLVLLKEKLVAQADILDVRVSMTDLFSMLMIKVLKKHPYANATMTDTELITYPYVNLGIAVATDEGLTVPVIKGADKMGFTDLSKAIKAAAAKARSKKLLPDDMSDGTFTISNVSMFPVDTSTPIINAHQTAILGMGRIVRKPIVVGDEIVIRPMMNIFMTYDHRAFDGSDACAILQDIKDHTENPERLFI